MSKMLSPEQRAKRREYAARWARQNYAKNGAVQRKRSRQYRLGNLDKSRRAVARWRDAHRTEMSEYSRLYRQAHPDAIREGKRRQRKTISDEYARRIVRQFLRKLGIPSAKIPTSLLEAKKLHLRLHRLLKEKSNENTG